MMNLNLTKQVLAAAVGALALLPAGVALAAGNPDQGTWATTLHPRDLNGDGATDSFYDTVLDITWRREANITNGIAGMQWDTARVWVQGLTIGAASGWRLPTMIDTDTPGCNYSNAGGTDCGYNVLTKVGNTTYSELAHLFYVTLGNKGYCAPGDEICANPQPGSGLTNTGDFVNLIGGCLLV